MRFFVPGLVPLILALLLAAGVLLPGVALAEEEPPPRVISVSGDDLQAAVDAAQAGDILHADPRREIILDATVTIDKPLTITGLRARLVDGLDDTPMLVVNADGFRMNNFHLTGNRESVEHANRASLVVINASDFVVEQGTIREASEHGIVIDATGRHAENGVVRDIIGHNIGRDHVSLQGSGEHGFFVKNVVVERIRAYGSPTRGAIEVSDGTENITVRDIYAEDCRYGVDFQDHVKQGMGQSNVRVLIENVFVRRCSHAVRSATAPGMGHRNLTLRNISGIDWIDGSGEGKMAQPIVINHTDNVLIDNVDIMGAGEHIYAGIMILNSSNVRLQNVLIDEVSVYREAILIENTTTVQVSQVTVNAEARAPGEEIVLRYRLNEDGVYEDLRVHDLVARGPANRIVLEGSEALGEDRDYHKRTFTGEGMEFGETQAEVALRSHAIDYDPELIDDRLGVGRANQAAGP